MEWNFLPTLTPSPLGGGVRRSPDLGKDGKLAAEQRLLNLQQKKLPNSGETDWSGPVVLIAEVAAEKLIVELFAEVAAKQCLRNLQQKKLPDSGETDRTDRSHCLVH